MSKYLKDAIKIVEMRDPFLPDFHDEDPHDMADMEDDEFGDRFMDDEDRMVDVGDEEDIDMGFDDELDFPRDQSFDWDEEEEKKLPTDYCPHCAVTHVTGECPEEGESEKAYWNRMRRRAKK